MSEVTIGGNASNNPPNYSWTDYRDYPDLDPKNTYMRLNVITFSQTVGVFLQVTGLVVLNQQGQPLIGPNDLCYMPCPPFCP